MTQDLFYLGRGQLKMSVSAGHPSDTEVGGKHVYTALLPTGWQTVPT